MSDSIDETLEWMRARRDNCVRIAAAKFGDDADDWMKDAAYFAHAISLIERGYGRPVTPFGRGSAVAEVATRLRRLAVVEPKPINNATEQDFL